MKLLLLCLGFYLIIFSNATAQDTIPAIQRSASQLTDSPGVSNSPGAVMPGNTGTDTVTDITTNTAVAAAATSTHALPGGLPGKPAPPADQDSSQLPPQLEPLAKDTIVDIFAEMKKASLDQDRSIKASSTLDKQPSGTSDRGREALARGQSGSRSGVLYPPVPPASKEDNTQEREGGKDMDIETVSSTSADEALTADTTKPRQSVRQVRPADRPAGATTADSANKDSTRSLPSQSPPGIPADTTAPPAQDSTGRGQEHDRDSDTARTAADVPLTDSAASSAQSQQKAKIESIFNTVNQAAKADSGKQGHDSAQPPSRPFAATPVPGKAPPATGRSQDSVKSTAAKRSGYQEGLDSARQTLQAAVNEKQAVTDSTSTPFEALFKPYRVFHKNTSIESTTSLIILQQHVDYKTKADFTTDYQRTGTQTAHHDFLFDVTVAKLNTEVETMGVQLKYDSNQQTDSTSTFAKPLFDIVGKRTFLNVDSSGKITSVDTSGLGRQINTVLSGLSLSGSNYEPGNNFGLLLGRDMDSLQLGEQWQETATQGTNKRITQYKIQNILDDELVVVISGSVEQTGEISSDGVVFKTHFTGTQLGKMRVDKATRLIKEKELTLNMKGTVNYNDQELPATAVSNIKESVDHD